MLGIWPAIRVGLLDLRGDFRRFGLLIICLAVGTALIAAVGSVLMGGDLELSRADRLATAEELALLSSFGEVSTVVDTNVRAQAEGGDAFVDLISVGPTYPLLGRVDSVHLPADVTVFEFLSERQGVFGALVDPLMLDQLGVAVGDSIEIGGTAFEVRGALAGLPDAAVRGFRLGLPAVITTPAFAILSDRTTPLPGLGSWFRYKLRLHEGDAETGKAAIAAALDDASWTVRSARDGLGPMVRYYDLFMRFLVIVGLAADRRRQRLGRHLRLCR
jgi:putative ABC transport system permease protein